MKEDNDKLRVAIVTWNLRGDVPPINSLYKLANNTCFKNQPDLIAIGTQECQRSLFMSFFCESKTQWESMLQQVFQQYLIVATQTLQGLHLALLLSRKTNCKTTLLNKLKLKAGFLCNMLGNKGAISISVDVQATNLQFINCHLQSNHEQSHKRNETINRIMTQMCNLSGRSNVFIFGDFNYRINMSKNEYKTQLQNCKQNTQRSQQYMRRIKMDQLINQQTLNQFLRTYQQGAIVFPPTYKLQDNENIYDNDRVPGWTDRIFSRKIGSIKLITYACGYQIYGSDHRPVYASYQVDIDVKQSQTQLFVGVHTQNQLCQIM